jgi:hypothetical protein
VYWAHLIIIYKGHAKKLPLLLGYKKLFSDFFSSEISKKQKQIKKTKLIQCIEFAKRYGSLRPPTRCSVLGCVWLDGGGGMERACHIFYTVWMGVTWGRDEPQTIFQWQRCPAKTNGWIRPRPSRGRKNRLAFHPYPIPSQPYLGGGAGAGERPSSRAGSRGRPSVQAQASGRLSSAG